MKSDKGKVIKTETGFKVEKSEKQVKREQVKTKKSPTNRDIADLMEMILERLS